MQMSGASAARIYAMEKTVAYNHGNARPRILCPLHFSFPRSLLFYVFRKSFVSCRTYGKTIDCDGIDGEKRERE